MYCLCYGGKKGRYKTHMNYEYYIKELIKERLFQHSFSKEDKIETLQYVKALFTKIGYNPVQFINELNNTIKEIMIEENICPKCYSDLELHIWNESRGEYFGTPVSESMSELKCKNCGWTA